MTNSMTAFGSAKITHQSKTYHCEIRSVNHRFLDINFRLPEELRPFESTFRELIAKSLHRGRIDCSIRREESESFTETEIDNHVVENLLTMQEKITSLSQKVQPLKVADVLRWPGVLQVPEINVEILEEESLELVTEVLQQIHQGRRNEGDKLRQLIEQRIEQMQEITEAVKERLPELKEQYRQRLEEKLESVRENMDENRIEQEMVLFLNKSDVMEELDRLLVHFNEAKKTLKQNKPQGRRLDFLMQELNREANTLGSKSQDAQLTQQSVELKVLIEQMREQVQNIE